MKIPEFGEQLVNYVTFRRLIFLQSLSINAVTFHIPIFKPLRLVTPEAVAQCVGVGREGHQPRGGS